LEEKTTPALLTGLAISLLNILSGDIASIATEELLPSWRLTFLLVTNQFSLNTNKLQIFTIDNNNRG
jgi:hypothetical protein